MRVERAVRNSKFAVLSQAVAVVMKAATQVVFVRVLDAEYLGIHGLFGNILTLLSLAELGVGSAVLYNLYGPLAQGDLQRVKALMNFYKDAYRKIGIVVLAAGLAVLPWLDVLIKGQPNIEHLSLIYVLYVVNNAASYFFIYKQTILMASQQDYLIMQVSMVKSVLMYTGQILFLLLTHAFLPYLFVSIAATVACNIVNSWIADKKFPYLRQNNEYLDKTEKRAVYKDVYALMAHRLGDAVVTGTDNMLLSAFVGVTAVGYYSNYVLILASVKGFLNKEYEALYSSIGNLVHTEPGEMVYAVYKKLYMLSFWLTSLVSIGFACLANPVIYLAFGADYVLGQPVVAIMAFNFYMADLIGIRVITNKFKSAYGLFWKDRYNPYIESALNLAISVVLLKFCGFTGVLLGTAASILCTSFWVEPYVLFRYGFHRSIKDFFKMYARYLVLFITAWIVTAGLTKWVGSWLSVFVGAAICILVPSLIFWLFLRKSREFQELKELAWEMVRKSQGRN